MCICIYSYVHRGFVITPLCSRCNPVQLIVSFVLHRSKDVFTHTAMSGFEIAGLVLGVIPLVVSTFENYKKGAQALENLRKYENNIQCLILNINVEQVRLQNVFERLLDGVVPPSQIDAMVKNPNGDLWTEQEVQEEIRLRLWTSWTAFQGTLRAIHEDITKLSKKVEDRSNVSHYTSIIF